MAQGDDNAVELPGGRGNLTTPKKEILRRIYLFSGLAEMDLEALARVAVSRTFPRETPIFWEGREPQGFHILTQGAVKLVKSSPEGKEYIIRLVRPGETFGEAVVFADSPYPATAIALEESHTLFFAQGPFLQLLSASPTLARNMLATLSKLLYYLTGQLEDLSLKEVSARLARYLLERCQETHGRSAAGLSFQLPTSKTHLAAYLGTISETLSRTLARLKSLEAIAVDKGQITIKDPALLQKVAKGTKS